MLRLKTLGGLTIESKDRVLDPAATQRKPLALLALLSRAPSHGVSRERAVALLWPEADEDRGRQVLRQTIYALRRSLGVENIVLGTTDIRLNPAAVAVDSVEFEALVARGDHSGALAAYSGPFLDGVHVRASPEFERWVDNQRRALEQLHSSTWTEHCTRIERAGEASVACWEAFATAYPLDSAAAGGVLRTRIAEGDLAGAAKFAKQHERILHEELGVQPSAEFRQLMSRLAVPRTSSNGAATRSAFNPHETLATTATAGDLLLALTTPTDSVAPTPRPRNSGGGRRALVLSAFGIVAMLSGVRLAVPEWLPVRARSGDMSASRMTVFPFVLTGPGAERARDLPAGILALVSGALDGVANLSVVNVDAVTRALGDETSASLSAEQEVARRYGAGLFLTGTIVAGTDDSVSLVGFLHDTRSGNRVALADARGLNTDLFRLTDDIARSVLAQHFGRRVADRLSSVAARTTSSLTAYRSFLSAEVHFKAARHAEAVEDYRRAIAEDSTFALAQYRLSIAADWVGNGVIMMEAARNAVRHSGRLGPREKLLVAANYDWRRGASDEAEAKYRELVRLYADDVIGWYELGEVQFHSSPIRGRPLSAAALSFENVLRLDSANYDAMEHLARVVAVYGERARAESLMNEVIRRRPAGQSANQQVLAPLLGADDRRIRQVLDSTRSTIGVSPFVLTWQVATYARRLDAAAKFSWMFLEPLIASERGDADAVHLEAEVATAAGRPARALAILAKVAGFTKADWLPGVSAYIATRPDIELPRSVVQRLRLDLSAWSKQTDEAPLTDAAAVLFRSRRYSAYLDGLLAVRLGDMEGAESAADRLDKLIADSTRVNIARALAAGVRAHIAASRGDYEKAWAYLEKVNAVVWIYGGGPAVTFLAERFLRGKVLERLGRDDEAMKWYESCGQGPLYEITCIGPALLARARIYDRRNDLPNARRYYSEFLTLWSDVEPELRPVVEQVSIRLQELTRN